MPNFFDVTDHFLYQSLAKKVAFRQISDDEYVAILPEMLPEHIKIEFLDQMKYLNEFGCTCLLFEPCLCRFLIMMRDS